MQGATNNPFTCHKCDKAFHAKTDLEGHMLSHIGLRETSQEDSPVEKTPVIQLEHTINHRTFSCAYCSYKTTTNIDLITHVAGHEGAKPFYCKKCDFRTAIEFEIMRHMLTRGIEN